MKNDKYRDVLLTTSNVKIKEYEFSCIRIHGTIPAGSEGNRIVEDCFRTMSEEVNLLESPSPIVVYDYLNLNYDFGDHLGAFFWVLPALLDNVGIVVSATGETLSNLRDLADFIGLWLPILFMESIESVWCQLEENGSELRHLLEKTKQCRDIVRLSKDRESPIPIVLLGSRQTNWQYRTGKPWKRSSDLDYGTVGNPKDLAIFASSPWRKLSHIGHPPSVLLNSVDDANSRGFTVMLP